MHIANTTPDQHPHPPFTTLSTLLKKTVTSGTTTLLGLCDPEDKDTTIL